MSGTLVLGLGNLLLGDEGVGVHAARALLAADVRPGQNTGIGLALTSVPRDSAVEVLDVGTAILDALPALQTARRIVVIDAVEAGGTPGTIYRFPIDRAQPQRALAGLHGFDITRALALAGAGDEPRDVVVLGVEPGRIEWSLDLSPAVAAAMPELLAAVQAEIDSP